MKTLLLIVCSLLLVALSQRPVSADDAQPEPRPAPAAERLERARAFVKKAEGQNAAQQFGAAVETLRQAAALLEVGVSGAEDLVRVLGALNDTLMTLGEAEEARAAAKRALGQGAKAFEVLERARGREMLDLLERGREDPLAKAKARAREAADDELVGRIEDASKRVSEAEAAVVVAERHAVKVRERGVLAETREALAGEVAARKALQRALRERLQLIREALPEGRPLSAPRIQALLDEGELMLACMTGDVSHLLVVTPTSIEAHELKVGELSVTGEQLGEAVGAYLARVLVTDVTPDTQAAKIGLRSGDVITAYAGRPTSSFDELVGAISGVDPKTTPEVELRYEREGKPRGAKLEPGRIGMHLARQPPTEAGPKLLDHARIGVSYRVGKRGDLTALPGTRKEIERISNVVGAGYVSLVGAAATEAALFEAVESPRILHLATHGLVDEGKGSLASALALTPPRLPVPGNDGFLSLSDLLERWRGKLDGTELVVLSACESQAGRLEADEGMFALPWGFCFADARSAIASLWKVDDEVTSQLMVELYRRLFGDELMGPCEGLQEARKAIRKVHPDPHHWAPFVFGGAP